MTKFLEEIKKLSRAEQLVLAQQIWDLGEEKEEVVEENEDFKAELVRRVQHAIDNPGSGVPWEQVKARMLEKMRASEA